MRPCGLSPCAPRYYYSTPRCTLVYSLVLSSVCCASVWCCAPCPVVRPVPCLPCLWCVCVVLCLWCVGASCPLLSLPLWVCATVCPVPPVSCLPYFLAVIPALYMGVLYAGLVHSLYTCPIFLGLLFMIRSVHTVKAGPWIPNADFQKSA